MKITGKPGSPTPNADTVKISKAGSDALLGVKGQEKSKGTAAPSDSSRVDVSARAQQVKKAKELATPDMNSVNEEKVARLQKMIDEGKYNVDADAIADRLVDDHLNFPS